jgi:hypothetical protein
MPKLSKKAPMKLKKKVMKEEMESFKKGELHSGKSKKPVKSRKQAIAIGLSVSGQSKKKKGK